MTQELPFHLRGNFAPVKEEITAFDLEVEGALPPQLSGLFARNGANPVTGWSPHWFVGHGMVHGVRLEAGRAAWYRNRYVRTPLFEDPELQRISPTGDVNREASSANTHLVAHAGRLMALEEGAYPWLLDSQLETTGCEDFGGKLRTAFTAHPKICPVTGELLAFGYGQFPPYLTYHRISAQGKLLQSEVIEVPGPTMIHDFAITERHAIFLDLPVVFDLQAALKGTMPFKWDDDYGARIGVMPRNGKGAELRWFEVEPCYIFHTMNAHEENGAVVVDACRSSEMWREAGDMQGGGGRQTLHRFTLDLASGAVREETLDERGMEFPRIADARVGQKNRYGYTVQFAPAPDGSPSFAGHLKFDFQSGKAESHNYGAQCVAGEPVFAAAPGADSDSDEGFVLSYLHDEKSGKSELVVLDASRFESAPVARVKLPQRVPYGFHGSWVADSA